VPTDMLRVLALLVPLVQVAGCVAPLAPRRGARPLALEEHFVYRRDEAPRQEPEGVWSGRCLPLAFPLYGSTWKAEAGGKSDQRSRIERRRR
jgi:hypothetical protein